MKNILQPLFAIGALIAAMAGSTHGQGVSLVKDINTQPASSPIKADSMVTANGMLYISTYDAISGSELWRAEPDVGSPGGFKMVLVKDINPGPDDALAVPIPSTNAFYSANLTPVGKYVYFTATSAPITGNLSNRNLWRTDTTKAVTDPIATVMVKDFQISAFEGGGPEKFFVMDNTLFFEGYSAATGRELWKITAAGSDTPGTPQLVYDIAPGTPDSSIGNPIIFAQGPVGSKVNNLFFTANDGLTGTGTGNELYKTDGTTVTQVADINVGPGSSGIKNLTVFPSAFGDFLYFSATGSGNDVQGVELWRTNGTVTTGVDLFLGAGSGDPNSLTVAGSNLYFFASDAAGNVQELYRTDGGPTAPTLVKSIRGSVNSPGPGAGNLNMIMIGGNPRLIFTADDGSSGNELWFSDGNIGNASRLKDIVSGPNSSNPTNFVRVNPSLYLFSVTDASGNVFLWKTDGTDAGTVQVAALPSTDSTRLRNFVLMGSTVYFMLNDDELWQCTPGAGGTTSLVKHLRQVTSDSLASGFTSFGGKVYFAATNGINGTELWQSNGTSGGTSMVADVLPGADGSFPEQLTSTTDALYFSALDANGNRQLWKYDGTNAPAKITINATGASEPQNLFASGGNLYFSADDGTHGFELWICNSSGASLLKDITVGATGSDPRYFVQFNDTTVFFVAGGINGNVYKTDGTPGGTVKFNVDILGGGSSLAASNLAVMLDNKTNKPILFFSAVDNSRNREVWVSDGTEKNTKPLKNINPNGPSTPAELTVVDTGTKRTLYFAAQDGGSNRELWKTDGTEAGTVLVKDIVPGAVGSNPHALTVVNGQLFFLATTPAAGEELWFLDSTANAQPVLVKDIVAGTGSPGITNLVNVNGVACFSADDGVNGRELWVSNGSANGTIMVKDFTGDSSSSAPDHFFALGTELYFTATTYGTGNELFRGVFVPNLSIESSVPAHHVLANGESVDFGDITFGQSSTRTFTIKNTDGVNGGLNFLRPIVTTITGTHAAEFTVALPKPATVLPPDAPGAVISTDLIIKFTPREDGPRAALLTVTSNDPEDGVFLIPLTGSGDKDPAITAQPVSVMKVVGQPVSLSVNTFTTHGPLTLQWKKGTANITAASNPTALSSTLEIPSVALTHAGSYSLTAKNTLNVTAVSDVAELGVVENIPKTVVLAKLATVTLTVNAAGNGLTYQWYKGATPLSTADARVSNTATSSPIRKTVTIKSLTAADSDTYSCRVTGPTSFAVGGTTDVRVFEAAPNIDNDTFSTGALAMPDGIVGGPYSYQVPLLGDFSNTPTAYSATKLPTGLKIDPKTGLISGKPTVAGSYAVTVTATNAKGKDTASKTVTIAPFPDHLAGTYTGLVGRHDALNGNLGGRVDLVVTGTGSFTGSLMMGATKYALTSSLDIDVKQVALPKATVVIKRTGSLAPLTLTFEIQNEVGFLDNATFKPATSFVTDGASHTASVSGWRQVYTSVVGHQATPFMGYYTSTFRIPSGDPLEGDTKVPQGSGYAYFTVAKDGKLTVTGKTADGEGITCATYVGASGEVLVFQTLYTTPTKGSLLGQLTIDPGANDASATDNLITGDLDWVRPPNTTAAARTYEKGFGFATTVDVPSPVPLEATGGSYGPLAATDLILDLTSTTGPNAGLTFTEAGIDDPLTKPDFNPNVVFNIGVKNKVTMPPFGVNNPGTTKFSVTPATGVFSGSFVLKDSNPRGGAAVTRTVNYLGLIVKDGGIYRGHGYFLLPKLPQADPVPPGTPITPTTTDILSGKVVLDQNPPRP